MPIGLVPFDAGAVLAMLRAFYPVVSPANLARALAERPEYFAGGVITRPNGDKIQLPDGRVYDCIINSGGRAGTTFWSCSLVTDDGPGVDDPFALEAGPLEYVDDEQEIFPGTAPAFVDLVAGHLGDLDGADSKLEGAGEQVAAFTGADELDGQYRALVDPAVDAHVEIRAALDNADPTSVIEATNSHDGQIEQAQGDYVEQPPPETNEPDPGAPPKGGGDGGDDGPPAA